MQINPALRPHLKRVHPFNYLGLIALLISIFQFAFLSKPAYALAPFTSAAIVSARLQQGVLANATGNFILITAKTTSGEAGGQTNAVITFGAQYTVNATSSNITFVAPGTSSCPTTYDITGTGTQATLTSWPLTGTTASGVASQVVTFTSTALSASTVYGFCITGGITNPASGTVQQNIITANGDSTNVANAFITGDQITVNATVPPTFTFTLSGTSDNFVSNLSTGGTTNTTGITATAVTNAATGYSIMVKSTNLGLKSATAANHIITSANSASQTTLVNNTEGYVLAVTTKTTNNTGTAAVKAKFDSTGGGTVVGGDLNQAGYQEIAYANNSTTSDAYVFKERATVSGITPAATDYTDVLTVVGAGNF
jgi:hypothetical protein